MQRFHLPEEVQRWAQEQRGGGQTISLVPTMGYLHEAHRSLIRLARQHGDKVVVSIFVNPAQFGPGEDLDQYPRDLENDLSICEAEGVDVVFAPEAGVMYSGDASVFVDSQAHVDRWEGACRPGHFRGVLTVVAKLFNLTLPTSAVFGEKDAQQLFLVQRMVRDLDWPLTIIPGPIIREPDGLALSSRNVYLDREERDRALVLSHALRHAEDLLAGGERDAGKIQDAVLKMLSDSAEPDYAVVVDEETFEPVEAVMVPSRLLIAARVGKTRLLDNRRLVP